MRFLAPFFALWFGLSPVLADGVSTPGVPHTIGLTGLQGPAVKYAPGGGGGSGYSGLGDVISSALVFVGLRAYNAAYAAAQGNAVNLRRASDNATCDFNVAATGGLGVSISGCSAGAGLTPAAFATQDATASCTIATNTATCTGASSTPHVGSTIAGAGVSQPCYASAVGTFTAGAGTVTLAGGLGVGSAPCGTVGSATTLTFTYGLFAPKLYDQSGRLACTSAACDLVQATAAKQPQLLPSCLNGLPCLNSTIAAATTMLSATNQNVAANIATVSEVSVRTGAFTTAQRLLSTGGVNASTGFFNAVNTAWMQQGVNMTATASDSAWHAFQFIFGAPGANSFIQVDATTGTLASSGANGWPATIGFGTSSAPGTLYFTEIGLWGIAVSSVQAIALCHNQFAYWGTSTSC